MGVIKEEHGIMSKNMINLQISRLMLRVIKTLIPEK